MDAKELQKKIKKILRGIGWSQAKFAEFLFYEENDTDNRDEKLKYVEAFKKRLSRQTTSCEILQRAYDLLCEQRSARNAVMVKLNYVEDSFLDPTMLDEMRKVSRALDAEAEKKRDFSED